MEIINNGQKEFRRLFGSDNYRIFFAPGRVNLIGDHTDYNGGHVFPCALSFGTYAFAKLNGTEKINMYSVNFADKGIFNFSINDLSYKKEHDWTNYPKGMIHYFKESGYKINEGMDIVYYGEIPNGAGLSSSASIEMVTGVMLEGLFSLNINRIEMVKLGKKVENEFIGVNSGIMDQFVIGMGKKGKGVFINCDTLEYTYAPVPLKNYKIVIMNTNKRRELADTKYNERRSESEAALTALKSKLLINSLGDLDEQTFEDNKALIGNPTLIKRAKHAVYENRRTIRALVELQAGRLHEFGLLLNESHISLRDDYEASCKEINTLVDYAWQQPGVLGARITGGGFGGCAIAIVEKNIVETFISEVGKKYNDAIGYKADFYIADIGDGAREIVRGVSV